MLKEQARLINRLTVFGDLLMVAVAFVLAYYLRSFIWTTEIGRIHDYIWVLLPALPVWYVLLDRNGMFKSMRQFDWKGILLRQANVHVLGGMALASVVLFFDREHFSRSLLLLFVIFSFVLLTFDRIALRYGLGGFRRRGYNVRNCLIVGTRDKARKFIGLIQHHADWGLRITGLLQVAEGDLKEEVDGHPVLGMLHDIEAVCKQHTVDEVIFCVDKSLVVDIEEQLLVLEELGITVRMVLDFYTLDRYRRDLSIFHDDTPILTFHLKSLDAQQLFLKRCLDILGGLVGLLLTALVLPFVALATRLEDPGPIFFSQWRIGENGRKFKIWKFRSMYQDAEARKKELMAQNQMSGAMFKIKDDPRVTRVGKFLRKTSLDEFPQFLNVLRGEMSLVGTRPPTPDEVDQYENWQRRRMTIKPGITGMWQVNGRSKVEDFDEIVRLDLLYIDSWNIWLDIRILFKTLWVVFSRQGSY